jgi:XXXCH domain-containing protein
MGSKEVRLAQTFTPEETADFLRDLAAGLEGGERDSGAASDLPLSEFTKLDLRIKRQDDRLALKFKLKHKSEPVPIGDDPAAADTPPKKEKYKSLKKRLQKSYDAIRESLGEDRLPASGVVDEFVRDSLAMATYPDKGEEFYDAYLRACDLFLAAFQAGDLAQLKLRCREIHDLRGQAHDKYK